MPSAKPVDGDSSFLAVRLPIDAGRVLTSSPRRGRHTLAGHCTMVAASGRRIRNGEMADAAYAQMPDFGAQAYSSLGTAYQPLAVNAEE